MSRIHWLKLVQAAHPQQHHPLIYKDQRENKIFLRLTRKDFDGSFSNRNFTKFTGKHLCQSLFFNKVVGLRSATLLKKRLWYRCFPVNFVKFLKNTFLQRTPLVAASVISDELLIKIESTFRLTMKNRLTMNWSDFIKLTYFFESFQVFLGQLLGKD